MIWCLKISDLRMAESETLKKVEEKKEHLRNKLPSREV